MKYDILIKNAVLINSVSKTKCDIGIKGEKISVIGENLSENDAEKVINADGKYVLPGVIDVHVHFQLPFCGTVSADDFENGTKAGAMGGVTTIIDFAIQRKGRPLWEAIEQRKNEAEKKVCIDYSLHGGIVDWNDETKATLHEIIKSGIPTFKMFMVYRKEGWQANDGMLFSALRECAKYGGMISVHAENDDVINLLIDEAVKEGKFSTPTHSLTRPSFTEGEAINRAIQLAEASGGSIYIVHMSTKEGTFHVMKGKKRGVKVYAETCPQYLLLDDELFYREDGHHFATCPPIRKKEDKMVLWEGLKNEIVEVVATDTCTFNSKQKAMWEGDFRKIPYGMPGVETMLPLIHNYGVMEGRFSINHLVKLLCENPAKLFGLFPQKGIIQVGSDADIVIFDPEINEEISYKKLQTNCDYSPYEGYKIKGWPLTTIVRGNVVVENRKFVGTIGFGKFIPRRIIK